MTRSTRFAPALLLVVAAGSVAQAGTATLAFVPLSRTSTMTLALLAVIGLVRIVRARRARDARL